MILGKEPAILPVAPRVETIDIAELSPYVFGYGVLNLAQERRAVRQPNRVVLPTPEDTQEFALLAGATLQQIDAELKEQLDAVREEVGSWNFEQASQYSERTAFAMSLNQSDPAAYLKQEAEVDWHTWISQNASDSELTDYIVSQAAHLAARQQQAWFLQGVAEQTDNMIKAVKKGLETDKQIFHPEAEEALPAIAKLAVRLCDYSGMSAKNWTGLAKRGSGVVHIEDPMDVNLPVWHEKAIRHEGAHASIGSLMPSVLYDEVITDHVAESASDGIWDKLNPNDHPSWTAAAYGDYKFVADAIWRGKDVRYLTRAYTAKSEAARLQTQAERLTQLSESEILAEQRLLLLERQAKICAAEKGVSTHVALKEMCGRLLVSTSPPFLNPALYGTNRRFSEFMSGSYHSQAAHAAEAA